MARLRPADMIEPSEPAEKSEQAEPAEPTENAEAIDPTEPTDSTEPAEPAERTELSEPTERIEFREAMDRKDLLMRRTCPVAARRNPPPATPRARRVCGPLRVEIPLHDAPAADPGRERRRRPEMPVCRYELRKGDQVVATGHLSREYPLVVGETIEIGGARGVVRSIEPRLHEHELQLVVEVGEPSGR